MVNSQIPLLTGQPSVDIELLQNNALSIPGWSVKVEFDNLLCSEPQSIMSENLHQMRLAPESGTPDT